MWPLNEIVRALALRTFRTNKRKTKKTPSLPLGGKNRFFRKTRETFVEKILYVIDIAARGI